LYAVPTLHFVKEALPLQGEQDGSLVREKKVLPDLVCRLIMQQLRFACHPAPPLSLKLCGETGELVCRFPGSGFLPDRNSISDSWHARVIDGHGLLP